MSTLLPATVSTAVAGRLLGFDPPAAFVAYLRANPDIFRYSPSSRRIALTDLERIRGGPITVEELLAAEHAQPAHRGACRKPCMSLVAGTGASTRSRARV